MFGVDTTGNDGQAWVGVTGSTVGTELMSLLAADDIQPGSEPGYQLCKILYLFHPLGAKMVESPIKMAMSQQRKITVADAPDGSVRDAFIAARKELNADTNIFNVMRLSRIYGIASVVYGAHGVPTNKPINKKDIYKLNLYFNVVDPLNTSGSLVLNQDPNAPDFLKPNGITVSGQLYHPSRSCIKLNEEPIYIAFTSSAFGFVGRSVYQRALFPLKSFIQSMITDDMVTKKAGVIVAKIKMPGSITDKVIQGLVGLKRMVIKSASVGNVINVGTEDSIESIDLQNIDKSMVTARKNILENIAAAASMPAQLINSETFVGGFGEGTEDAKTVVRYIDDLREEMQPLYDFFDELAMYKAWNPEFYEGFQKEYPEYKKIPYTQAFYQWKNSFTAEWPSLLIEPEHERIKADEAKIKAIVTAAATLLPECDPENRARVVEWLVDSFNQQETLFKKKLDLDYEEIAKFDPDPMSRKQNLPGQKQPAPIDHLTRSDSVPAIPAPVFEQQGNEETSPAEELPVDKSARPPYTPGVYRPGIKKAFK